MNTRPNSQDVADAIDLIALHCLWCNPSRTPTEHCASPYEISGAMHTLALVTQEIGAAICRADSREQMVRTIAKQAP